MRKLAIPTRLLAAAALVSSALLAGCSVSGAKAPSPKPPPPPRPTLNHKLHLNQVQCNFCHDPDDTGTPHMPKAATCYNCHDKDLKNEPKQVQAYFAKMKQPDGSYRFETIAYGPDLILPHAVHAKAGVKCAACHGQASGHAFVKPPALELMKTCTTCHEKRKAPLTCATCHKTIRKDKPPPSHSSPRWLKIHGKSAPAGWRTGKAKPSECALCHRVPQDCTACHRTTKPQSHFEAGWVRFHGRGYTDAIDVPFKDTECSICHEQQSCTLCHQRMKPRSHTPAFERRLHGIAAELDRSTCETCHKQDTCTRCHQTTAPLSHTGSWSAGQQTHCLACHEPLTDTNCFVCHKNTLGHRQAPPLPRDAVHAQARTSSDCRDCHTVLPHFGTDVSCRRCHR